MAWNDSANTCVGNNDSINNIDSNISKRNTDRSSGKVSLGKVELIGLSASGIGEIKVAINNYIEEVSGALEKFIAEVDVKTAFAGTSIVAALDEYLLSVKNYINGLVLQLKEFDTKLANVLCAWEVSDKATASQIDASSSVVQGATTSV
ncbi:MAG: hypothetical protein R3Y13_02575 [bacterium]